MISSSGVTFSSPNNQLCWTRHILDMANAIRKICVSQHFSHWTSDESMLYILYAYMFLLYPTRAHTTRVSVVLYFVRVYGYRFVYIFAMFSSRLDNCSIIIMIKAAWALEIPYDICFCIQMYATSIWIHIFRFTLFMVVSRSERVDHSKRIPHRRAMCALSQSVTL